MYNKVEICGVNTATLKVLTESEKMQLLRRMHEGDASAREDLVNGNLRLVLSVIQRFTQRGENLTICSRWGASASSRPSITSTSP